MLQLSSKEESSFAKEIKMFSDIVLSLYGSENQKLYGPTQIKSCKVFISKTESVPQLLFGKADIWLCRSQLDGLQSRSFKYPC